MSAGLTRAGFNILLGVDNWEPARRSYSENFDHPVIPADIGSLTPEDLWNALGRRPTELDLVAGGPPCQGFSIQRIGDDRDDRNNLVLSFGRLVKLLSPRMFLMENVTGLLGKRGRATAEKFQACLEAAGYHVAHQRVNAADYGIPQLRKRVFFYGWRVEDPLPFSFPVPTTDSSDYMTVMEAIGDLPDPPEDHSPHPSDPLHRRTRLSARNLERLKLVPPGGGFESLPVELRVRCHKNGADKIGHRSVYGRLAPDKPAGTITARFDSFTRGRFAHPVKQRNISLREGARLQTFLDSHIFLGGQEDVAAQIGNAVPPLLAEALGKSIRQALKAAGECRKRPKSRQRQLFQAVGKR